MSKCPRREDIADYCCNQLTDAQRTELESHAATCPACADELRAYKNLAAALRAVSLVKSSDVTASVQRAVYAMRFSIAKTLAAAASIALLFGGGWWLIQQKMMPVETPCVAQIEPEPEASMEFISQPVSTTLQPAVEDAQNVGLAPDPEPGSVFTNSPVAQAFAWLLDAQDATGGWSMGRTGAGANYTVGISALALLALQSGEDIQASARHQEAVSKGIAFLVSQQDEQGLFGPDITGSLYNHTLACLALLERIDRTRSPVELKALQAGLDILIQNQHPDGGWSYLRARSSKPNSGLTTWALLALMEADSSGILTRPAEIARGLDWLKATIGNDGRAGYRRPGDHPHGSETLTAAAALCLNTRSGSAHQQFDQLIQRVLADTGNAQDSLDFYRAYFQSAALREAGLANSPEMEQLIAKLESAQSREGLEAGSWAASDPWSKAGGRVYSTAMAVLALREM